MAQIGVIVPVYKVESYLDRCVQSILCQSHQEFFLVLVDDGSPDNCGALCDEYAREDFRIHVIHQKNRGLSAARNSGLDYLRERSDCQWVTFVDSDDWLHPEMLRIMLSAAEENHTKVSVCGFAETSGNPVWTDPETWQRVSWKPEELFLQRIVNATVAWGKLYHLDCFAEIRFPVGKIHEDEFTTYQILLPQQVVVMVDAPLYAYFVNPSGITRSNWRPQRLDAWEAYEQQLIYFQENYYETLYRFRLRDYLQNALVQLSGAENTPNMEGFIPMIEKQIRNLICRCWHEGLVDFRYDFDMLVRFYPWTTRAYRFYLEKIRKVM